ncbi:hypothetical protein PGT21_022723 [Puccinia graminis f. sp. tritici]|uniref:Uncharacterized protein n=1 Tax=Puccinia graminis f. sp. tritici TaxID=56615 RepID=A0A5B0N535_PUCGR|nr:hypothetical protein PGT21_022723 [Puccinia graminis f. sp. tritici]KAA1124060.1 hypothetical protein PGTUg99_024488 [Puccinia graminis f. sp. tritici]
MNVALRGWPIDKARKEMDDLDAQLEAQLEAWYNGLVDSPEPDTPEMKQFDWKQGDLAIKGFELLSAHLFHWPSTFTRDTYSSRSLDRPTAFEEGHPHSVALEPATATTATSQQHRRSSG